MTDQERITELENEICTLRHCVDVYHKQQGPLLLEIDRLRKALAKDSEAA